MTPQELTAATFYDQNVQTMLRILVGKEREATNAHYVDASQKLAGMLVGEFPAGSNELRSECAEWLRQQDWDGAEPFDLVKARWDSRNVGGII